MHRLLRGLRGALHWATPNWHPLHLKPVARLVNWLVERRRPEVLHVKHGFDLIVPRGHRSPVVLDLFLDGEYEPEESRLILDLLRPGDLAFDVGAYVGYTTCLMARAVAGIAGGEVHAFEPAPDNFAALQKNVSVNGFEGVSARHQVMSGETGETTLYLADDNFGDHTVVALEGRETTPITCTSFDDYYAEHCSGRQVRLVKVDVQGHELDVLKGMRKSLAAQRIDFLLLEFWPARLSQTGISSTDVPALLSALPYEASVVSNTGSRRFQSLSEIADACAGLEDRLDVFFSLLLERRAA